MSVDRIDGVEKARATYDVPFPMLSDPDLSLHEAFRVVHTIGAEQAAQLAEWGMDLEAWSGRDHHKIAIPSMFLIDTKLRILWAHAAHDHRTRPPMDALLGALRGVLDD